jgi:hypothetical protein
MDVPVQRKVPGKPLKVFSSAPGFSGRSLYFSSEQN